MKRLWHKAPRVVILAAALGFAGPAGALPATQAPSPTLRVRAHATRVEPGSVVHVSIDAPAGVVPQLGVLVPGRGLRPVTVTGADGRFQAEVTVPIGAPEGFRVLYAWSGSESAPSSAARTSVLVGHAVVDFWLPAYVPTGPLREHIDAYVRDFASIGGNTIVAHALITPEQAWYPSAVAKRTAASDYVEMLLAEADERGMAVLLSVSWDLTRQSPYADRGREIRAIMAELYRLYARHPSFAGFYSYQEGSGTYYVPYVREFAGAVKALDPGLLSAVAPYIDDPLLAGYLATIEPLDIIMYQGMVMASYRPDNRKLYPLRRVKDFAALGIGAARLQGKIAITHVELFGYLENRRAGILAADASLVEGQIRSVATAADADGIALFAYQPHVYAALDRPEVRRTRDAVAEGLREFERVQHGAASSAPRLSVYVPYSDWIVERWTTSILPALDGFRVAGVAVSVLPYSPPLDESIYPYYPYHLNPRVLDRLLADHTVLVLPDISGFQQTDSDLINDFLARGGAIVAFGPQIPMGRSYERDAVFGGREIARRAPRRTLRTLRAGARVPAGRAFRLGTAALAPRWEITDGAAIAAFEDGSPAIVEKHVGKGLAIAVLPDARTLADVAPDLVRDVLDRALTHSGAGLPLDVVDAGVQSDVAVSGDATGARAAVANHGAVARTVTVRASQDGVWRDTEHGELGLGSAIQVRVPAGSIRIVAFTPGDSSR